ncbi:hypothetical protein NGF19_11100 [Streptomyces sp. RY43-2]|uniref:Antitoxin VbhA domain-containing protein n=1 Tax=Streptomyces macrolidinus TaxID=2952607 RepID=A0ABT0ZC26_9ACTN|nr:hypothetical protein [Streptomyces macrolidinus]MCN9241329.1 hypothetical protein [Streptomyces macrolidinus]
MAEQEEELSVADERSLRAYIKRYAAGDIPREEMLETIAAWPLEEEDWDEAQPEPSHQDNTASVIYGESLLGRLTEEDVEEIHRRRKTQDA